MRLYIPLSREEYEALERLAFAERRRPRDQAVVLIAKALAEDASAQGANADDATEHTPRRQMSEADVVAV